MPDEFKEAPLFANARRELVWIMCAWVICGLWVVGVSWWGGTRDSDLKLVLGLPGWVFWGVGLPWLAANLFTFWFCLRCMTEDSLHHVAAEAEHPGPNPSDPSR